MRFTRGRGERRQALQQRSCVRCRPATSGEADRRAHLADRHPRTDALSINMLTSRHQYCSITT